MADLAGYVICALILPKGVLWDLEQGSEKASPFFKRAFHQTTSVQTSMFEFSCYPFGREICFPRNIAIEFKVQHRTGCPHTSQFMFPIA
ncbi:hypothetical protein TNCV_4742551 [Trichonephila clavipes]|nr:hypothetical protein TNCV_4742551 [Trichonephila clavipes]